MQNKVLLINIKLTNYDNLVSTKFKFLNGIIFNTFIVNKLLYDIQA